MGPDDPNWTKVRLVEQIAESTEESAAEGRQLTLDELGVVLLGHERRNAKSIIRGLEDEAEIPQKFSGLTKGE